jgi:FKBP-type peptidyl-prolyl cis-trans isomerase
MEGSVEKFAFDMKTAPTPILIEELVVGEGPQASGPGQFVTVHYTGWLEDGSEFDSSRRGEPFSFPLGVGYVIPGWDQGLVGMRVGGKRRLTIPSELGYGARRCRHGDSTECHAGVRDRITRDQRVADAGVDHFLIKDDACSSLPA